jgi:hypothetical protein
VNRLLRVSGQPQRGELFEQDLVVAHRRGNLPALPQVADGEISPVSAGETQISRRCVKWGSAFEIRLVDSSVYPPCDFSVWRYADERARTVCARSLSI